MSFVSGDECSMRWPGELSLVEEHRSEQFVEVALLVGWKRAPVSPLPVYSFINRYLSANLGILDFDRHLPPLVPRVILHPHDTLKNVIVTNESSGQIVRQSDQSW